MESYGVVFQKSLDFDLAGVKSAEGTVPAVGHCHEPQGCGHHEIVDEDECYQAERIMFSVSKNKKIKFEKRKKL